MNLTLIIQQAFVIFCIVITIWICMLNGMIFGKIGDYGDSHFPDWLKKIVYDCAVCQTPYYGSAAYWVLFGNGWQEWIVVILVAMGMATIFVKLKKN